MTPGQAAFEKWQVSQNGESVNGWDYLDDERKQVWESIAQAAIEQVAIENAYIPNVSDRNRLNRIKELCKWQNVEYSELISRTISVAWIAMEKRFGVNR